MQLREGKEASKARGKKVRKATHQRSSSSGKKEE
jgi:hypothetical protein